MGRKEPTRGPLPHEKKPAPPPAPPRPGSSGLRCEDCYHFAVCHFRRILENVDDVPGHCNDYVHHKAVRIEEERAG